MNQTIVRYQYVQTDVEAEIGLDKFKDSKVIGVDIETTGLDPKKNKIRLVQISSESHVLLIDWTKITTKSKSKVKSFLKSSIIKVFHNAKFDLSFLAKEGIKLIDNIYDTMIASQLLYAGLDKSHTLQDVVAEYLSVSLPKDQQKSDWSGELSREQLEYAARDVAILLDLRRCLNKQLHAEDLTQAAEIEFLAIPAFVEMELIGITVNTKLLNQLEQELEKYKKALRNKLTQILPGVHNFNSHAQLKKALIGLGVPLTGTSKSALIPFVKDFPVIQVLLDYKKAEKLIQFTKKIQNEVDPITQKLHSSYFQCGTASGRVSCRDFNLQQIPNHKVFRKCFVAGKGKKLVIADYSQIELRIAAEISEDPKMINAYNNNEDLHRLTASLVNQKSMNDVSASERQSAKCLNFGLLYGMGAKSLAEYALTNYNITMSHGEAQQFRDKFFQGYQGLKKWHHQISNSHVSATRTLSGRKRSWDGQAPFTQLTNTPVQGTGADILKCALGILPKALEHTSAKMVATVHDEIILVCDEGEANQVKTILKTVMEKAGQYFLSKVPVIADPMVADDWGSK